MYKARQERLVRRPLQSNKGINSLIVGNFENGKCRFCTRPNFFISQGLHAPAPSLHFDKTEASRFRLLLPTFVWMLRVKHQESQM